MKIKMMRGDIYTQSVYMRDLNKLLILFYSRRLVSSSYGTLYYSFVSRYTTIAKKYKVKLILVMPSSVLQRNY